MKTIRSKWTVLQNKVILSLLGLFLFSLNSLSQEIQEPSPKEKRPFILQKISGPVILEGLSDEKAWENIQPLPLVTIFPAFGNQPSERTEILVGFDGSCLYVAGRLYELILWYCEETKQYNNYKTEPWFQFARIIRNIVSHKQGGILRQWPEGLKKKGISQVSWRNRIIDEKLVGKDVEFTHHEALQLFKDQLDFVVTKLA